MKKISKLLAMLAALALVSSSVPFIVSAENIPAPSPYDNTAAVFDKIFFLEERTGGNSQSVVNENMFALFNRLSDSGVTVSDSAVFLLADAEKIGGAQSASLKFTSFVYATVTSIDMELYIVPPNTSADLAAKLREPLVPAITYYKKTGSDTDVLKHSSSLYDYWNGIKTAAIAAASANKKDFHVPVSLASNGNLTMELAITDRLNDMAAAANSDGKVLLMLTNFVRGGSGNFNLEGRYFGSANGTILPHIALVKDAEAMQGVEGDFTVVEEPISDTKLIRTNNGLYSKNTFANSTHSYNPFASNNASQIYIPADLSQYTDAAEYIEKVYLKIPGRVSGTNAGHISIMGYDNLSLSALTSAVPTDAKPTDEPLRQYDSTAIKLGVYKSEDEEILADVTGYVKAQISAGKPLMFATREAAVLFSQTRPAPSIVLYIDANAKLLGELNAAATAEELGEAITKNAMLLGIAGSGTLKNMAPVYEALFENRPFTEAKLAAFAAGYKAEIAKYTAQISLSPTGQVSHTGNASPATNNSVATFYGKTSNDYRIINIMNNSQRQGSITFKGLEEIRGLDIYAASLEFVTGVHAGKTPADPDKLYGGIYWLDNPSAGQIGFNIYGSAAYAMPDPELRYTVDASDGQYAAWLDAYNTVTGAGNAVSFLKAVSAAAPDGVAESIDITPLVQAMVLQDDPKDYTLFFQSNTNTNVNLRPVLSQINVVLDLSELEYPYEILSLTPVPDQAGEEITAFDCDLRKLGDISGQLMVLGYSEDEKQLESVLVGAGLDSLEMYLPKTVRVPLASGIALSHTYKAFIWKMDTLAPLAKGFTLEGGN